MLMYTGGRGRLFFVLQFAWCVKISNFNGSVRKKEAFQGDCEGVGKKEG